MRRVLFFSSVFLSSLLLVAVTPRSVSASIGGPCSPPVAGQSCQDTVTWSGPQVTAHHCVIARGHCPDDADDVLCCVPLSGGETGAGNVPTASQNSNTQGAAAASAPGAAITADSNPCSFNGVHDPFCGQTVAGLVGKIIQFLLGAAGALFLAMFVYGGAVWLTAGSSDRHQAAQKTLLNASAGILVVLLSYTMVSLLVRLSGDLGGTQGETQPVLTHIDVTQPSTPSGGAGAAGLPSAGGATPGATGSTCNAAHFITACHAACADSTLVSLAGRASDCNTACDSYGPAICSAVHAPGECDSGCSTLCASPQVPEIAQPFCSSKCGDLCAAAFR